MTRAADILRHQADHQQDNDYCALHADVVRAVGDLMEAVADHNRDCRDMCGSGDQEGVRCGYRPYFPRRCPECYLDPMCAPDRLAALERLIAGESDATSK